MELAHVTSQLMKCAVFVTNVATSAFLWLVFTWNEFFSNFWPICSLYLKCISYTQSGFLYKINSRVLHFIHSDALSF